MTASGMIRHAVIQKALFARRQTSTMLSQIRSFFVKRCVNQQGQVV